MKGGLGHHQQQPGATHVLSLVERPIRFVSVVKAVMVRRHWTNLTWHLIRSNQIQ